MVEAARQAILEKSLQDNENIGDLYPEILQATLAKLGALNLSSNETVKAISAINWSLLKSSKSRTSQNQETNKNTVENILTIISEKSFSNKILKINVKNAMVKIVRAHKIFCAPR